MVHVGIGYDVHALVAGRKLILGGVEIPHTKGLDGHSDADALMHAICDALLGALGEPDIGHFFPNTDPRWKGAPSQIEGNEIANKGPRCVGEAAAHHQFRTPGNLDSYPRPRVETAGSGYARTRARCGCRQCAVSPGEGESARAAPGARADSPDRKSTRLN